MTHLLVVLLLSLSFISGLATWYAENLQNRTTQTPSWIHVRLVLHDALNPILCVLFGYLCCQHVRIGWQLKANLLTGFSMELIFAGLILSGAGLY